MAEVSQGAQVTVLVVHQDDDDAIAMLTLLEEQVERGDAVEHLTLAVGAETGSDAALWRAHRAGAESSEDPLLFERLADIGRIDRLRMVAVTTVSADATVRELDRAMHGFTTTAARLLGGDRRRTHARLAIMGYGEPMTSSSFFSTLADVNAAVLPYDRLEDASIARPVERATTALFRSHGAVEIASACGLWRTMESAPLDELAGSTASGSVPRVRFLQSRIRLLRTPALPVSELVAERREIPVADGFLPAADAERLMPRLADLLLPPELVYEEAPEPQFESQSIAPGALARILGAEIVQSFIEMPSLIWRAFGGEVSTLTRRVLQQAIGESSRFRVADGGGPASPRHLGGLLDGDGRPVDLDTVVSEPEVLAHFDPIPGEIWTTLVAEVLGSIDGDPDCRDLREQAFGDARFLPVERSLLLGGLGELPPRLAALLEERSERSDVAIDEVDEGDEGDERLQEEEEEASDHLGSDDAVEVPAEPAEEEHAEHEHAEHEHAEHEPSPPPSIVGLITEEREAIERIVDSWQDITEIAGGLWSGARATYRAVTPVALAGGILTLSAAPGEKTSDFHLKRASSPNFVDALLRGIDEFLERSADIHAVDVVADLDGWEPMMHDVMLSQYLGLDAEAGELDKLLEVAVLVADDARPLRHEALVASDLERLSAFVVSAEQGAFLRDYATFLRTLATAPSMTEPPPTGDPIGGLAAVGAPSDSGADAPPPNGLPFIDIPPPSSDRDEEPFEEEFFDDESVSADPTSGSWGLLVGIREQIRRQREVAERDVERILVHLRATRDGSEVTRTPVSPAVPVGAGLGIVLLLIWMGQTDLGVRVISSLGLNEFRRDALFTVLTLILVIGASTLTDLGKSLSAQARSIIIVGASVLVSSAVLLFFEDVRQLVPMGMRVNNLFAFSLGAVAVALVMLALLQSLASGDPVRIQGSRVLVVGLVLYAVAGIIVWQVQSRAGLVALDESSASGVGGVLLSTAVALLFTSVAVLSIVRFRESRRRDDRGTRDEWSVEHIGLAVDARERLRAAERQWVISMIAIAQVLRQPFGPFRGELEGDEQFEDSQEHPALKAASVRVRLTERGRSDLEARIRQMLVGPSWLRRRYQAMVDAHQRILATRLGMPVRNLVDRRPEADPTVPSERDLRAGRGRGDRMDFVRLTAAGMFDASLAQVIEDLDVRTVFEPMLAEPESHVLDGYESRASTVEQYFQQLIPESDPTLPNDLVTTVLAANDRRRHLRPYLWWPTMLPDVSTDEGQTDFAYAATGMFRHGTVDGAGLVAVRVDASEEFLYTEIADVVASSPDSNRPERAAEGAVDYGSDVGL